MRGFLMLCLLWPPAQAADLSAKLDQLISHSPPVAGAFVGVQVVRLSDGQVLYAHNANRLFVPASNMKLFTTSLALQRLGPDYRLKTQIVADRPIDSNGTLAGDLRLVGGGDPSLSGRDYPYREHASPIAAYSFQAVEELADQLTSRGLQRVDGDVVGDDRRYVWEPHPSVWSSGSATEEYGAPVSALILDDNSFALTLRPATRRGDLAQIWVSPPLEYFAIDNRVLTVEGGERNVEIERDAAGRELQVWGELPRTDPGITQLLAVEDPALWAAGALRDALLRRGVSIHGDAAVSHRFQDDSAGSVPAKATGVVLAERASPPLRELLKVVDKVSQNLHAEVLLREVAVAAGRPGSREAGLREMAGFLEGLHISRADYQFTDGSGLSRSTLVSPNAITKLLVSMYKTSGRELWVDLLPVGGQDGTLGSRFTGHPESYAIRAKTGTLDHVRALAGYAESPLYGPVAFSFVVNNFEEPAPEVNQMLDELALALLH
jgi:D-alanyl-D-alanine carboxypeptidase/D-alanyl-D-alanine-endopeptidase (penicillin-binding protein 4)